MTIKEIAALAGVSTSTVSKIMNGKDQNIHPDTRSRVLKVVKEHHYEPYSTVKNNVMPKKFLIGLLLSSFSNVSSLMTGIIKAAQEHGYQVLLFHSNTSMEQELKNITALCSARVDGVIWEPVCSQSAEYSHLFSRQNIPIHYINAADGFSSFSIDFGKAGYELTQKLIQNRHSNIACVLRKNDSRSESFQKGFQKCLYDHEISFQPQQILYDLSENPYAFITAHNITGIVSAYYTDALMVYKHMEDMLYHVPAALSIVSLRDDSEEDYAYPHISCIRIPYHDFGYYVCQSLIRVCEKTAADDVTFVYSPEYTFTDTKSISVPSSLREKKLVVVGSIHMDMTFLVDRLPQAGKTTEIYTAITSVGGKGANQSVGAAKLGCEVSLIGKLGNDLDSAAILNALEKEHVDAHGISREQDAPTGKAYIYTGNDGESTITILSGANRLLRPEDIRKQRHLFKSAVFCLLSTEIPTDTIIEAAKAARAAGAKVVLKPSVLKTVPDELFLLTDIFIPNQKEAFSLCPQKSSVSEQAAYFIQKGVSTVIITLGDKGCYLKTSDIERKFPAAEFYPVDTTGGADAFISALVSYLAEGYDIEKAIQIATCAAGFCVSRQGVVSALTDRSTLETYIAQNNMNLLLKN
ncbi:MAG: PfkB family carbohydrate kinase [Marvinbryantia sp.]|uniref:PfkB family carbohydrate kinase n=2 Tax=Marvinbryantia sp. TaxID=2496532 RepID=UPI0025E2979F|nr:PfkB family carbohydrate kinase [uncultured Marvinbryantia sp.]